MTFGLGCGSISIARWVPQAPQIARQSRENIQAGGLALKRLGEELR
jgi:hypothetical protein